MCVVSLSGTLLSCRPFQYPSKSISILQEVRSGPFRYSMKSISVISSARFGPFRFVSVKRDTSTDYLPYPTVCCLVLCYATLLHPPLSNLPTARRKVNIHRNGPANWIETSKGRNDPGQHDLGRIDRVPKWLRAIMT